MGLEPLGRKALEILQGVVPAEAPEQAPPPRDLEGELLEARLQEGPRGRDVDPQRVADIDAGLLELGLDGLVRCDRLLLEVLGQQHQEVGGVVGQPDVPLVGDPALAAAVVADHVVGDRLDGQELARGEHREGPLDQGVDGLVGRLSMGGVTRSGCGHGEPPKRTEKQQTHCGKRLAC
ncbi:hypothetical protein D3C86_1208570 [compost metagenome]